MSLDKVRAALETALEAQDSSFATAWENTAFTKPANDVPYQKVNLLPAMPDNSTQGNKHYQEVGLMQVTLCYPQNAGPGDAQTRAVALRNYFKRGSTFTSGGVKTIVTRTPAIGPALIDDDRYCIPVSISYQADIFT